MAQISDRLKYRLLGLLGLPALRNEMETFLEASASGPVSSTDNAVVRFDGTSGDQTQNSVVLIGDSGDITGVNSINTITSTEISYLDNVSSNIQTQLNGKVSDSGDTMTGQLSIEMSAGPQLRLIDSGAFGVNANPYLSLRDGSAEGGRLGFDNAASNQLVLRNLISNGSLTIQTSAAVQAQFVDSSTGNNANYSSLNPTMRLKGALFGGASTGDYPYLGFNARSTGSGASWEYDTADKASLVYFTNGGVQIRTTSTTGVAGDPISFTQSFAVSDVGAVTLGASGGSQSHQVNGSTLSIRRDHNGNTMLQVRNDDTGASAAARLAVSSDQGDFNVYALSGAAGDYVSMYSDSAFSNGLLIGALGNNPVRLRTNSENRISISGAGEVTIGTPGDTAAQHAINGDVEPTAGAVAEYLVIFVNGTERRIPLHAAS